MKCSINKDEIAALLKSMNSEACEFKSFEMASGNSMIVRLIARLDVHKALNSMTEFDTTVEIHANARPGTDVIIFKVNDIKFNPVAEHKSAKKSLIAMIGVLVKTGINAGIEPFINNGTGNEMLMNKISAKIKGLKWHSERKEMELSLEEHMETESIELKINSLSLGDDLVLDMSIKEKIPVRTTNGD
jgi:hypothetical protein